MKNRTRFGYVNGKPLAIQNEKHALIMASTRSGKGTTLIIPHLLRYPGSAFVLDPKGENAYATGRQRGQLNDKVHYLDPFGISRQGPRARFNPLSRFTPETMDADAKTVAAALVVSDDKSDHWVQSGQQLLTAFILYVYASPELPPTAKDLPTMRRLLLNAAKATLEEMAEKDDLADGQVAALARSFLQTPEKEFGSILSTAQRETDILDNPQIAACLSATGEGEEINFAEWHEKTMTVYLCLAAPKFPVFNRWLRLVLCSALDEMTTILKPPPLPVCFMLDELATLGHVAAIENAVGLAAGYGVQLYSIFQDIGQMRHLYKGRWPSFVGNAGVRALFALDDIDTAEYWSKFLGNRLVSTSSHAEDIYGLSQGNTIGEAMRPLQPPDEMMMKYATDKMLMLVQGMRPIVADRIPYFDDPSLTGLWDDPRELEKNLGADGAISALPSLLTTGAKRHDP